MQVLELRQGGHLLIDLRVILHRTRTQRIETGINAKVIIREIGIVAHHGQLVTLRQCRSLRPAHGSWYLVIAKIILGQTVAFAALFR